MKFRGIGSLVLGLVVLTSCEKQASGDINKQIEQWVKDNPEIIMDSLMEFQRQEQERNRPQPEMVTQNRKELFEHAGSPVAGNPKGKVEIAYFFDFNCGHCARQSDTIKKVLEARKDVKVVYKNFPVLGPSSELAARAALAAHQQGRFTEYYSAVYQNRERSMEALEKIARDLKLNIDQWKKDFESDAVNAELAATRELAQKMRIGGTPFLAIAPDKVFPGRVDELANVIANM